MHNPESVLENATHKILRGFVIEVDQLNLAWRPDLVIVNKKKKSCRIVYFAVLVDHKVKLKESEKPQNMKVTTKPSVIGDARYIH